MRAVVVSAFGGPELLRVADVPEPKPGQGEVSVTVRFAGVNYTDVRNRRGAPRFRRQAGDLRDGAGDDRALRRHLQGL